MAGSEQHGSVLLPPCISLLRLRLLAVHYVVYLVDETDDYFRYFACYMNNMQSEIIYKTRSHYILGRHVRSTWNSSQVFSKLDRFAHARYSWLCAFKWNFIHSETHSVCDLVEYFKIHVVYLSCFLQRLSPFHLHIRTQENKNNLCVTANFCPGL